MARILICDPLQRAAIEILELENEVVNLPEISRDELLKIVAEYDAIVVRARTKVDADVIAKGRRLRVIARAGVGTDNIDVDAATEMGVLVVNSPDPSITSVAEHTFTLLLGVCRRVPKVRELASDSPGKRELMGVEVQGKTLGIVGLGRIGSKVATIAKGFGLEVMATDPFASHSYAEKLGAELVDLPVLLAESDFVTLHVPLTDSTKGLIGAQEIEMMKPDSILVNTSRAEVVDEVALLSSLRQGRLLGAGLDVFQDDHFKDLIDTGRVFLTPHMGASTREAQTQIAELIAREVNDALRGRPTRNPVNMPFIDRRQLEVLQPFIQLSEKMVKVLCSLLLDRPGVISLSLMGEASEVGGADFILRSIVMGIISSFHEVNVVNAMATAERMGIKTEISRSTRRGAYQSSMELKVETQGESHSVRGALLDTDKPRIVGVEGYDLEFIPEGHILMTEHQDVPGMVGTVGTRLGSAGINIGTMHLARREVGKEAMMIILTDKEVPATMVEELAGLKGMARVATLEL